MSAKPSTCMERHDGHPPGPRARHRRWLAPQHARCGASDSLTLLGQQAHRQRCDVNRLGSVRSRWLAAANISLRSVKPASTSSILCWRTVTLPVACNSAALARWRTRSSLSMWMSEACNSVASAMSRSANRTHVLSDSDTAAGSTALTSAACAARTAARSRNLAVRTAKAAKRCAAAVPVPVSPARRPPPPCARRRNAARRASICPRGRAPSPPGCRRRP